MHIKTIACIDRAEALLNEGDEASLRYACLELRMGIEFLFYELIPLYAEELPHDIARKWRPQQLIHALLDCDPDVEQDKTLSVYYLGENNTPGDHIFTGKSKAISKSLIKDHWHKLGSFLHAPMRETDDSPKDNVEFLRTTISALREYDRSKILCNISEFVTMTCYCGTTNKRKLTALAANPNLKCLNPLCAAEYHWNAEEGKQKFEDVLHQFGCSNCGHHIVIHSKDVRQNGKVVCESCKSKFVIDRDFVLNRTSC